jgi:hypothetical protein
MHGEIKVAGEIIALWRAGRVEDLKGEDGYHLYHAVYQEVGVWDPISSTYAYSEPVEATVEHRYSDGAAALLRKVLVLADGPFELNPPVVRNEKLDIDRLRG